MTTTVVKSIPVMDLMSFLLETPDSPKHIGGLQIFKAPRDARESCIERILASYRNSEVSPPFNYVPVFPSLSRPLMGAPKWASFEPMDLNYHVRHIAVASPGTLDQLISMVTDLHQTPLDRSRPGWLVYVIEGLEKNQFAIYSKVHHAYIDGLSAVVRMDAALSKSSRTRTVVPMWAPLKKSSKQRTNESAQRENEKKQLGNALPSLATLNMGVGMAADITQQLAKVLLKTTSQSLGLMPRGEAPLPFSAPRSLYNQPVHAARSLGVGSIEFDDLKVMADIYGVSVNEMVLALVGDALEDYSQTQNKPIDKALVAVCPMAVRAPGNTDASTQIAALAIKLGEPYADIETRLAQVRASSSDAKQDAQAMSREALMSYLVMAGGLAELLDRPPFNAYLPPLTNVNVSNVRGPTEPRYLSGAKLVRNIPLSTLAGGTAINITFFSMAGKMEFAIIADATAISDAQAIASGIETAFDELLEINASNAG